MTTTFRKLTHFLGILKVADLSRSSTGIKPSFLSFRYIGSEAVQIEAVPSTSLKVIVVSRSGRGPLPFTISPFGFFYGPLQIIDSTARSLILPEVTETIPDEPAWMFEDGKDTLVRPT